MDRSMSTFSSKPAADVAAPGGGRSEPVDLETYYTEAGMDYRAWSPGFNMHFGYYRWGLNPLRLEAMLEEMSEQVFRRLELADGIKVLDLGCGLGAPARQLIASRAVHLTAVTRVGWQIAKAKALGEGTQPRGSVEWVLGDFTALERPSGAFQGAFSIEASCHAAGASKEPFIRECARLLAPGARLVIADGFMKRTRLPRWYAAMLGAMTRRWAVERFADLDAFLATLEQQGFIVVAAEDASWRIAPSVMHVPRVSLAFLASELLVQRKGLSSVRWGHLLACVLAPLVGLGQRYFGYYLITAQRRA
jgi:MPBQ/MSBQ methyltransferase